MSIFLTNTPGGGMNDLVAFDPIQSTSTLQSIVRQRHLVRHRHLASDQAHPRDRVRGGATRARRHDGGIECILTQARKPCLAGLPIEQARDREALAGLEGADRRLRLGGKKPIDGPRVIPEVAQMSSHRGDLFLAQVPGPVRGV